MCAWNGRAEGSRDLLAASSGPVSLSPSGETPEAGPGREAPRGMPHELPHREPLIYVKNEEGEGHRASKEEARETLRASRS